MPALPPLALAALAALAALDLVLPHVCAGCGEPVRRSPVCPGCLVRLHAAAHAPRPVAPRPRPAGLPPVHAGASYGGVVAALLRAWKDGGRRDLGPVLAGLLLPVLRVASPPGALLVPVPTSPAARRRRGDAPLLDLLRRTASALDPGSVDEGRGPGPPSALLTLDALRVARRVADQAGLDHRARAANLDHALVARVPARLAGRPVVLVDDVLTTGATLAEAARAVRAAGGHPVAAAVLAATRRRREQEDEGPHEGPDEDADEGAEGAGVDREPGALPGRWNR